MVLLQLSIGRFLTVYIAQGVVIAIFLYLAIKILLRDRKRLNNIFAGRIVEHYGFAGNRDGYFDHTGLVYDGK